MTLTQDKDAARLFSTQDAVNRYVRTETQRNKKKGIRDVLYQSEDASGGDMRHLEALGHFTPEHFALGQRAGRTGYVIAVYECGLTCRYFMGYLAR